MQLYKSETSCGCEHTSLFEAVQAHKPNLRGADLSWTDLKGADLRGADLVGADLQRAALKWAHLEWANLSGANLREANLYQANLKGANLSGAYLRGADLSGAYLVEANLEGANLREANLHQANLEGANLKGANLKGTCLDPKAPIPKVSDTNLRKAGFTLKGDWAFGWRTSRSQYCGSTQYLPGKTYKAEVFSVASTPCHPGIYLAGKDWLEREYPGVPLVPCKCKRDEIHKAGDKFRTEQIWILEREE